MVPNSILPAIVPGIIILLAASVAAGLGLAWVKDAQAQQAIRRAWVGVLLLVVLGVAIFWISSAMVRQPASTVDRNLQQQQQIELQQRNNNGGH
jgi:hypothetical protein